jgi:transposase
LSAISKWAWKTIKKYLDAPGQEAAPRQRQSKLDAFKAVIAECLEKDPLVTAALILQRIKDLGYSGGHAILQEYVAKVRPQPASKRAFVRIEPFAGERFEVDWAHFDTLNYSGDIRKLYAFVLIDAACSMWSSRTARAFKPLRAATCMRFMHCREWHAKSSMTISLPQ